MPKLLRLQLNHIRFPIQYARRLSTRTSAPPPPPKWPPTISAPLQSYISLSHNPYANLSIEHHLLTSTPPYSAVLFLYRNRPCIVIGRNQNPWLEVNLPLLKAQRESRERDGKDADGCVELVRRRSGGGTVYHDLGNLNWTVISPAAGFTRDKHVEMVVRALRGCGVDRARVNERHDIVLDQGSRRQQVDSKEDKSGDLHNTAYTVRGGSSSQEPASLKVSGSAYKLTRQRALHHATLLLSTADLARISRYLKSPGRPYISAKGVESVSSSVGKIDLSHEDVAPAIQHQYQRLYRENDDSEMSTVELSEEEALAEPAIRHSCNEMQMQEWMYGQTPQFTFSTEPDVRRHEAPASKNEMGESLLPGARLDLNVRHGRIKNFELVHGRSAEVVMKDADATREYLENRPLWGDWEWSTMPEAAKFHLETKQMQELSMRMEGVLPVIRGSSTHH